MLSVIYFSKALAVRNSAGILSGAASRLLQEQQNVLTTGSAVSPPRVELHRSFETPLSQGQRIIPITDKVGRQVGVYTESHALVVGISNHTGGWPSLPGVKKDVNAVTEALEKQGFHVVVVMDPNLVELEGAYRGFVNKYGLNRTTRHWYTGCQTRSC